MRPLLVNFFGAPGAGKTTMAMQATVDLRCDSYTEPIEYVPEYAKMLHYLGKLGTCPQTHVTLTQYAHIDAALEKNMVVITDSPVLLGLLYIKESKDPYPDMTYKQILDAHNRLCLKATVINFFVPLPEKHRYCEIGREQTYDEACEVEKQMKATILPITGWNTVRRKDYPAIVQTLHDSIARLS